jgi:TPR repeat protein
MKKINTLFFVCFFAILATIKTNAQDQKPLNCEANFSKAIFYIKRANNIEVDSLKAVSLLQPCLAIGDDKAQLLMGNLHEAKMNEQGYKKAFKLYKKSAKQGNATAAQKLGVLYKYGRGCNLNFNKARKWFKKSAKLGNDKAKYSLGYLYLKGFGNIPQNYFKAVKWFQ